MNLKTLNSPTVEARGNKIVHLMNRPYRQQSLLRFFNNNNNNTTPFAMCAFVYLF